MEIPLFHFPSTLSSKQQPATVLYLSQIGSELSLTLIASDHSTHFMFVLPVPRLEHLPKSALGDFFQNSVVQFRFVSIKILRVKQVKVLSSPGETHLANFRLLFIFGHLLTVWEVKLLNVLVPGFVTFVRLCVGRE